MRASVCVCDAVCACMQHGGKVHDLSTHPRATRKLAEALPEDSCQLLQVLPWPSSPTHGMHGPTS